MVLKDKVKKLFCGGFVKKDETLLQWVYLYVMYKCVCVSKMRVLITFFLKKKKKEGSFQERFFDLIYGITEDQRACVTCFKISGLVNVTI